MEQILEFLTYVNTTGWLIASVAAFKFKGMFANSNVSWTLVMIGSILMLGRQLFQYLPGYGADFDMQVIRFGIGILSGLVLVIGFYKLNKEAKTLNEF